MHRVSGEQANNVGTRNAGERRSARWIMYGPSRRTPPSYCWCLGKQRWLKNKVQHNMQSSFLHSLDAFQFDLIFYKYTFFLFANQKYTKCRKMYLSLQHHNRFHHSPPSYVGERGQKRLRSPLTPVSAVPTRTSCWLKTSDRSVSQVTVRREFPHVSASRYPRSSAWEITHRTTRLSWLPSGVVSVFKTIRRE